MFYNFCSFLVLKKCDILGMYTGDVILKLWIQKGHIPMDTLKKVPYVQT